MDYSMSNMWLFLNDNSSYNLTFLFVSKLFDGNRGPSESSLFNIYYTTMYVGDVDSYRWYFDSYLIQYVKLGGITYHFLSLWY